MKWKLLTVFNIYLSIYAIVTLNESEKVFKRLMFRLEKEIPAIGQYYKDGLIDLRFENIVVAMYFNLLIIAIMLLIGLYNFYRNKSSLK